MALSLATAVMAQGQGGGRRGGGFGMTGLLRMPEVQTELKLQPAQVDLLTQLGREMGEKGRQLFQESQSLSQEERGKKFAAFQADQEKKVAEILDAKQMARLKQLDLQRNGLHGLERGSLADDLKLTPDQRAKVQEALTAERTAMQPIRDSFRTATPEQREENRKKFTEIRSGTDAKLNGILTDTQKKQFLTMQGAPFKFPERQPGQNRRRGAGQGTT
jgi:hypothetical protein